MISPFIRLGNTIIQREAITGAEFDEVSRTCHIHIPGKVLKLRGVEGEVIWKFLANKSRDLLEDLQRQAIRQAEKLAEEGSEIAVTENSECSE